MKTLTTGPFAGCAIRKARKPGRCHYWLGEAGRCTHEIQTGELYVEGEPLCGGSPFARQRWCLAHFKGDI